MLCNICSLLVFSTRVLPVNCQHFSVFIHIKLTKIARTILEIDKKILMFFLCIPMLFFYVLSFVLPYLCFIVCMFCRSMFCHRSPYSQYKCFMLKINSNIS